MKVIVDPQLIQIIEGGSNACAFMPKKPSPEKLGKKSLQGGVKKSPFQKNTAYALISSNKYSPTHNTIYRAKRPSIAAIKAYNALKKKENDELEGGTKITKKTVQTIKKFIHTLDAPADTVKKYVQTLEQTFLSPPKTITLQRLDKNTSVTYACEQMFIEQPNMHELKNCIMKISKSKRIR
jgi:hypothetical protein